MFECLVLGDSIGVGIGQQRTDCLTMAKVGITSENWFRQYGDNPLFTDFQYKIVVISLGTNDFKLTKEYLSFIRSKVKKGGLVVWIAPSWVLKPVQRRHVEEIAKSYGDKVLDISKYTGAADKIHPTGRGYRDIADITRDMIK